MLLEKLFLSVVLLSFVTNRITIDIWINFLKLSHSPTPLSQLLTFDSLSLSLCSPIEPKSNGDTISPENKHCRRRQPPPVRLFFLYNFHEFPCFQREKFEILCLLFWFNLVIDVKLKFFWRIQKGKDFLFVYLYWVLMIFSISRSIWFFQ